MQHIVVVPYFSDAEIHRYLLIAEQMRRFAHPRGSFEFLMVSGSRILPNRDLFDALSEIAPVRTYVCENQVFGYPQGASAMFWETMDHIADVDERDGGFPRDGGFSLWLESDMVPVKPNWLGELACQWADSSAELLLMGVRIPNIYARRLFQKTKLLVSEHINGGACYAKNFSRSLPDEVRQGAYFDLALSQHVIPTGRYKMTNAFAISTVDTLVHDVHDPETLIVHGWRQDKDQFVDAATRLTSPHDSEQGYEAIGRHVPSAGKTRCCEHHRRIKSWLTARCPLHHREPVAG